MAEHTPLCLRCRTTGHVVNQCPSQTWLPELDWMFSEARRKMDFSAAWAGSGQILCRRCEELDLTSILDSYPPWHSLSELNIAQEAGHRAIRRLGKTGTIEFWADCHVCCCLSAMTPNPSSAVQEVLLFPDWTLCHVTGEGGVVMDTIEKRQYATCLVIALDPSSVGAIPFAIRAHRGDAMCLMENELKQGRTLGGVKITRLQFNFEIVEQWLSQCIKLHGVDCVSVPTAELDQIRLVDVYKRQVVSYPYFGCDYVALSYVWGKTTQGAFRLGDHIGKVPKSLEDAISFTIALGKQYVWIDSLCINQSDQRDKKLQIDRMWSIYRGAYVTIMTASGTSAEAGLSGFSRSEAYPQLTCRVKNRRLVGIMPTLSQQTWVCPWSHRAWTLQEAMLSPRCLYFTDHQMYFDCTAMLCCESLDPSRSLAHGLTHSSNPTNLGFTTWMMDQIGAGGYRNPLDDSTKRLQHWGMKLNLYSYRTMSESTDGLRAFEGILQRLRTMYPRGFHYGLPIEDFDWGLLWRSQWPPTRCEGFPSWTWAGWEGGLWYGQPLDVTKTRQFSVPLEIFRFESGQAVQIFKTEPAFSAGDDLTNLAALGIPQGSLPSENELSTTKSDWLLLIDTICLHFVPDFSNPQRHIRIGGQLEEFKFFIRGTACFIRIISIDKEISRRRDSAPTFLLIARDRRQEYISNHLLMVDWEPGNSVAYRATALELLMPAHELHLLHDLKPRRRRILLA